MNSGAASPKGETLAVNHAAEKGLTKLWIEQFDQPAAQEKLKERLRALVQWAGRREVVDMAHHPLISHGTHGGFFDLRDHVFPASLAVDGLYVPLPVLGSLYALYRGSLRLCDPLRGRCETRAIRRCRSFLAESPRRRWGIEVVG